MSDRYISDEKTIRFRTQLNMSEDKIIMHNAYVFVAQRVILNIQDILPMILQLGYRGTTDEVLNEIVEKIKLNNDFEDASDIRFVLDWFEQQGLSLIVVSKAINEEKLEPYMSGRVLCVEALADSEEEASDVMDSIIDSFGNTFTLESTVELERTSTGVWGQVRYAEISASQVVLSNAEDSTNDEYESQHMIEPVQNIQVENDTMEERKEDTMEISAERHDMESDKHRAWNGWNDIHVGHEQAMTAMKGLRDYVDGYKKELAYSKNRWRGDKERNQQVYDTETAEARQQCEAEIGKYKEECENNIKQTGQRRNVADDVVNACQSFVDSIPTNDPAYNSASYEMDSIKNCRRDVLNAITKKNAAYRTLCECQIAESERICGEKIDDARKKQIESDNVADQSFSRRNKTICGARIKDIEEGFNKATIHAYRQGIRSSRFHAINYGCPTEVPEYVMLGDIGICISGDGPEDIEVVHAVELQTEEVGCRTEDGYTVCIPYAQSLSEGISLMMRYSPAERENIQSLMQPLLLKLFMSFPAGKLEATMIDPLELGATFPDIPKLAQGPDSARIIDTKIWSKERDIENAIATLRQRLENITQAFGGDMESRLKKEAIRVLAITDFPTGFNDAALKDLQAIVRNSATLGVCVFICANDEELEKLNQRYGTLMTEIMQSVVSAHASKQGLMLLEDSSDRIFLKLDDMQDVLEHKEDILSLIRSEIERKGAGGTIETFESMYRDDIYDSNNWFIGNHEEIAIPLGVKGADTIVKMVLGRGGGSTEHHALIAGQTGAGKSTLLHTLIMSTLISYSPDEVQMYLLDFKEGVEFSSYTQFRLPSLRVVAINSEREFGLSVLKELCTELETRTKHFTRYGVSDINSYIRLQDVPKVPKLLLIFDEVQELFRNRNESDSISAECLSCLNKLIMQGRAMGIHIILACQDFRNCAGIESLFHSIAIRIAVKGSEDGASSILNSDNNGIHTLQNQPAGAAIYNNHNGVESANNFFQVAYMQEKERLELLSQLDRYFTDPDIAPLYEDQHMRVLLTNAEDDIHNCFNRLILEKMEGIGALGSAEDAYGLLLGQGFGKKSIFMPELRKKERENLLVVCKDEKMALALFELSAMSVLYEELHTDADKNNALVYIVDLFADELEDEECTFDYMESQFPKQVRIAKMENIEEMIGSLYETFMRRAEGAQATTERIFFLLFGINRARKLQSRTIYEQDQENEISSIDMLKRLLAKGPQLGINSIVWSESTRGMETVIGDRYESMFAKRIAYGLDDASMDALVAESESKAIRGKTAVYMDIERDIKNTHFRPYDIPAKIWVERYAEVYDEITREGV